MLRIVILFSLWSVLVCFQPHMKQLSPSSVKIFRNHVILEAKKKSGESKGFAKKSLIDLASIQTMTSSDDMLSNKTEIVQSDRSVNDEMFLNEGSMPMQVSSGVANGKKKSQTSSAVTQRGNFKTENEVFSKYGIKDGSDKNVKKSNTKTSNNEPENAAFGKSVLAKFPAKVQAQLDSTLITLTFGALIVVIITGNLSLQKLQSYIRILFNPCVCYLLPKEFQSRLVPSNWYIPRWQWPRK